MIINRPARSNQSAAGWRKFNLKVQRFRGSEVQRFRGSEVQRFRGSEVQKFRSSEVQRFRGLKSNV
jgi:hypothetical protein